LLYERLTNGNGAAILSAKDGKVKPTKRFEEEKKK
jgi:hypothetical protein